MLRYWKDGKEIRCDAIHDKGHVGQVVIFDRVSIGNDKHPLKKYPQPYVFTIMEKIEGKGWHYVMKDAEGELINIYSGDSRYFYDAIELVTWEGGDYIEKQMRSQDKIRMLESQLELLKNILTKQGIRIVTQEEAEKLGIA